MLVSTKLVGNNLYIYLDGELDHSVADKLKNELDRCISSIDVKNVILNMKRLRFMDSTGIGLIMGRYKKFKNKNIKIYIDEPSAQIDKVLKVSGLYNIIPII